MKSSYILALISAGVLTLANCHNEADSGDKSETETPRIKNYSKLTSPKRSAAFKIGDPVPFEVASEKVVDSVTVEYRNESTTYPESSFAWTSSQARTGNQRLKLTVYLEGTTETHYPRLKFLSDVTPEAYTYQVVESYPHSTDAYTQGLFFKADTLFESTGSRGKSRLMKVNHRNGEIYKSINLESQYFGEGSTYWKDRIYMLTWTSQIGFIFDTNLNQTGTFRFAFAEGWGMATFGDTLIISDGTEKLHFLNPNDLSEFDQLEVYDHEDRVVNLNELEVIDDLIYANVYQEERIVVIDPNTGKIIQEIDLSGLLTQSESSEADVLNGIAYNPKDGKVYVTGKLWPRLFQVSFVKK